MKGAEALGAKGAKSTAEALQRVTGQGERCSGDRKPTAFQTNGHRMDILDHFGIFWPNLRFHVQLSLLHAVLVDFVATSASHQSKKLCVNEKDEDRGRA